MFEIFRKFWRGIRQMFGYTTLKNIVGKDIALSKQMIDAIVAIILTFNFFLFTSRLLIVSLIFFLSLLR